MIPVSWRPGCRRDATRPRPLRSAATRVAIAVASAMLAALLILGGGAVTVTYALMARSLDRQVASASADVLRVHGSGGRRAILAAIHEHDIGTTAGIGFSLFTRDGVQLAGPRNMPAPRLGWADHDVYDPIEGVDPARMLTVATPQGDLLVTTGNRRPLETTWTVVAWLFLASCLLVVSLCGFLGLFLARYLRSRLSPIVATVGAVRSGDLDSRVAVGGRGDEFDIAAAALNLMLDRIADLMDNLRQVSSDLAHDLRTPLTRIRLKLERLGEFGGAALTIEPIIAQVDEVVALFDAILRIAQIEGAGRPAMGLVDLEALALDVVGALTPAFAAAGMTVRLATEHDALVTGDPVQLGAMLVNLLENVLRHAGPGAEARVTVAARDDAVALTVRDTGRGVAAADVPRIFERFVRLDPSRSTPGHGLGLSLVQTIATAHGASIEADGGDGGFRVSIVFPTPDLA